jgi:SAM-dependent methyltransferase
LIPYDFFARFYDRLMADIDYKQRAEYFSEIMTRFGVKPEIVLDLACGTGSLTLELARAGYDVIGVDRSEGMLSAAADKAAEAGQEALFLCQDMRSLDLYGTIGTAICHLDGMNHLMSPQSVKTAFSKVALFLEKGGLFIFDLNSLYKIQNELGDNTFIYDLDDIYCVWQNSYSKRSRICRFDLTFFERRDGVYSRGDEHFGERAYTIDQIRDWLALNNLRLDAVYDGFSFEKADDKSKRLVCVAVKE